MLKPRAFVVMPFGRKPVPLSRDTPEETVDVEFDALYEQLIAPALTSAGCDPFRADEELAAGDIRTDMFFELVAADVVVAEISILNPNVFYELGVRHGVAERGVFMLHAGWTRAPFDVAADRTFRYDAGFFLSSRVRDDDWERGVEVESRRVGDVLRRALAADERTIGSPVYAALRGLKPADWTRVETARAKYFRGVLDDWRSRVRVARRNGHPGDILTLARDAPTRAYQGKLMLEAARALVSLQRFEVATRILEDLVKLDDRDLEARTTLALVRGRLDRPAEAEELVRGVLNERPNDPEALGVLGRIHKDAWRSTWIEAADIDERRRLAAASAARARQAIRSYAKAHLRDLEAYYTGINVVGLARLLQDLGADGADAQYEHVGVDDLAAAVRVAARQAFDRARDEGRDDDAIWAAATLGELELVSGESSEATGLYSEAVAHSGLTLFQLESMIGQLSFYEELGFRTNGVSAVRAVLEAERVRQALPDDRYRRVAVCSGHMIDEPGRLPARFPASKEVTVRKKIAEQLDAWNLGAEDLAICGGARGADLLFAELCLERGVNVQLLLPLPEARFRSESLRLPGGAGQWEERFDAVLPRVQLAEQGDRIGEPPPEMSPFARNNLWLLDTARVEATDGRFFTLLVWDEQPTGDGPGGTSDFAVKARGLGAALAVVNPLEVPDR
jgi:tetratricopeptide (TPR) repeat protein